MIQEFAQHTAALNGICARERQLKRGKLTSDQWANKNQLAKFTFYKSKNGKDADPGLWKEMVDFAAENETALTPKPKTPPSVRVKDFNDNFPRWTVCDRVIERTHRRVLWDQTMKKVMAANKFNVWEEVSDGSKVQELIRKEIETLVREHANDENDFLFKAYTRLQHIRQKIYAEDWKPKVSAEFVSDVDPEELALPDGQIINLQSMELRPISVADRVTHTTAIAPDFSDGLPLEDWLDKITKGEDLNPLESVLRECLCLPNGKPDPSLVAYFVFALGVSLIGDNYNRLLFLHLGAGKNGKTLLVGLVKFILGTLAGAPSAQHLFGDFYDHPQWLLAFHKTRMTMTSEPPDDKQQNVQRLRTEVLKEITGSDPITARKMRAEEITFISGATPHILLNKLPQAPNDQAFLGRCRIIPWNYDSSVGGDDVTLFQRLKEPEYAGQLMAHGCQAAQIILRAREEGRNPMPYSQQVEDATRGWAENEQGETVKDLGQIVISFIGENCTEEDAAHEYLRDFCRALRGYIEANGIEYPCGSPQSFNQRVGKLMDGTGYADTQAKRKLPGREGPLKCVQGIRLKPDQEPPSDLERVRDAWSELT